MQEFAALASQRYDAGNPNADRPAFETASRIDGPATGPKRTQAAPADTRIEIVKRVDLTVEVLARVRRRDREISAQI